MEEIFIKQYEEVRKIISAGQGNDYTTGCLLDYVYFKDDFRLIAAYLNKKSFRCRSQSNSTNYYYRTSR